MPGCELLRLRELMVVAPDSDPLLICKRASLRWLDKALGRKASVKSYLIKTGLEAWVGGHLGPEQVCFRSDTPLLAMLEHEHRDGGLLKTAKFTQVARYHEGTTSSVNFLKSENIVHWRPSSQEHD